MSYDIARCAPCPIGFLLFQFLLSSDLLKLKSAVALLLLSRHLALRPDSSNRGRRVRLTLCLHFVRQRLDDGVKRSAAKTADVRQRVQEFLEVNVLFVDVRDFLRKLRRCVILHDEGHGLRDLLLRRKMRTRENFK